LLAELDARMDLSGHLYDMRETWGVSSSRPVPARALLHLEAPSSVLHAPGGDPPSPVAILADPHSALPVGSDRLLAMVFYDADRAVLYTRSQQVLHAALFAYVGGVIEDLAGVDRPPTLDDEALNALATPVGQGGWREIHLERAENSWVCELRGYGAPTERWIGNRQTGWRTGWVW